MTWQQEQFCYEYVRNNYKARKAYETVYGVKPETARSCATRLLMKQEIKDKIAEIRKVKLEELQVDADRVTEKLAEIAFSQKGGEYYNSPAQLKALELLSKTLGMQVQKIEAKQEVIEVGVI